jgi:Mg/Co/Ni transporter MgtE
LNSVKVDTEDVEVAHHAKYDLEAIPVVDELGRLVGASPLMILWM